MKSLVLGVVLFLSALWGGFYAANYFGNSHWATFPIIMTGLYSGVVSIFLVIRGLISIGV